MLSVHCPLIDSNLYTVIGNQQQMLECEAALNLGNGIHWGSLKMVAVARAAEL